MPRIATAASADEEASSSRVDDLIQRGRSQGHLSLSDLRTAFEQAGLTPGEARSILRELSEAGVRLADEETELKAPRARAKTASKATGAARASAAKATGTAGTETAAKKTRAKKADQPAAASAAPAAKAQAAGEADGDTDFADDDMVSLEADVAAFADGVDLDDQTPAMGDSVHTYLKSIGRTSLLTAEQEVDLPSGLRRACSPSTSWTPSWTLTRSSAVTLSWLPRTGGARRRTCSRPTCAWLSRSRRSTATAGFPSSTSCRRGTWA